MKNTRTKKNKQKKMKCFAALSKKHERAPGGAGSLSWLATPPGSQHLKVCEVHRRRRTAEGAPDLTPSGKGGCPLRCGRPGQGPFGTWPWRGLNTAACRSRVTVHQVGCGRVSLTYPLGHPMVRRKEYTPSPSPFSRAPVAAALTATPLRWRCRPAAMGVWGGARRPGPSGAPTDRWANGEAAQLSLPNDALRSPGRGGRRGAGLAPLRSCVHGA